MERPDVECSPTTEMERLVQRAMAHLEEKGYSPETKGKKQRAWEAFTQFAADRPFTAELAHEFLNERGILEDASGPSLTNVQRETRTAMRQLTEFKLYGCFQRRRTSPDTSTLPVSLEEIRVGYMAFCRDRLGHRPQTLQQRKRFITRFLTFLDARDIATVEEIDASLLSSFVMQHAHLKPKTVGAVCGSLRSLLRYLCMRGLIGADLRNQVPVVRVPRDDRIPDRWQPSEVDALLAAVNRASPKGKRDYAILVLAARLGMRTGDIRRLQLEHLHWDEAKIAFIQEKTRVALSLPMTDEVGSALIDYLRHGRPATTHRDVFLRVTAPFDPITSNAAFRSIITEYRRRAGIAIPADRAGGMHALRHSLASRLLERGTSLETISHIMGHVTPTSTQVYAKVGIEELRNVALDWEVGHE